METKHKRPSWVKEYKKPVGTEIKYINGHWYLYERKSLWDAEKGKPKKKSGKLIGTITESGLVLKQEKVNHDELVCYELGASYFMYQVSSDLKDKLVEKYNKDGLLIYTISFLILKDKIRLNNVSDYYKVSYIKILEGRLSFSKDSIREALEKILSDSSFNTSLSTIPYNEFIKNPSFSSNITEDKEYLEVKEDNYALVIYYISYLISVSINQYLADKEIDLNYIGVIDLLRTLHVIRDNRKYIKTKAIKKVKKLIDKLDISFKL